MIECQSHKPIIYGAIGQFVEKAVARASRTGAEFPASKRLEEMKTKIRVQLLKDHKTIQNISNKWSRSFAVAQ